MGLASALNTALTGMSASETTIGVIGNNLANANTAGFKASDANFATQFLQTQSIGSSPTADSFGTNPTQIGLGALVASITPNFSQGTIQTSNSPTDMAIQGSGFFTVSGATLEQRLYTRNGVFQLSADNMLETTTGNAVMGYVANSQYTVAPDPNSPDGLDPISIPLGSDTVAQATSNVALSGSLSPTGAVATQSEVLQTGVLGDAQYASPLAPPTVQIAAPVVAQDSTGVATNAVSSDGSGSQTSSDKYSYELVAVDATTGAQETVYAPISVTLGVSDNTVTMQNLPYPPPAGTTLDLYRANTTGGATPTYHLVASLDDSNTTDSAQNGVTYTDGASDASIAGATTLNTGTLSGSYSYYVTFVDPSTGIESCPSPITTSPLTVSDGSIELSNLPAIPAGSGYTQERIYRNLSTNSSTFYCVGQIDNPTTPGVTFIDNISDATASQNTPLNFNGPAISGNTLAINVTQLNGSAYNKLFSVGTLKFTADVGGSTVATPSMQITDTTTVTQVLQFMQDAMGIQSPPGNDPNHPIPAKDSNGYAPGFTINNGQIQFTGNTGTANAISIGPTDLQMTTAAGSNNVNLTFNTVQAATGDSASTDFVAYDAIGTSVNVHLTTVLQSQNSSGTVYRWYAECPSNIGTDGNVCSAVGTGTISFDSTGNYIPNNGSNSKVTIEGPGVAGGSLAFNLNFSQISGLASSSDSIAVSSEDGSAPGTLTSFTIGQDGTINGVFSNGLTRPVGQIMLTTFANPDGLEQQGQNLFAAGVNSGKALISTPGGGSAAGTIIGGATELSNTDIGANLVDLILSSTMYQGNSQVITTVNTLFNDLLTLVRNG